MNKFDPAAKGAVSFFYRILHNNAPLNTASLGQAWADELNAELEDEVWDECLKSIHDCSVNVRHCLMQFKTLHRLYYSREKLHSFFPDVSPICNRCKSTAGNLIHSFWLCSKLHTYWKNTFHCFSMAIEGGSVGISVGLPSGDRLRWMSRDKEIQRQIDFEREGE